MKIISKISDPIEKADLYFGIDPDDLKKPFVLGGCSNDLSLPPMAQWGAASTFGLENLNDIGGAKWNDWRASLRQLGCDWVIPIIEKAENTKNVELAIREILKRSGED